MRFRLCLLILCSVVSLGVSACAVRRAAINQPSFALQTQRYVVLQTSQDMFVILTKSSASIGEIQQQLGCDKEHVCAGLGKGEIWTIERMK